MHYLVNSDVNHIFIYLFHETSSRTAILLISYQLFRRLLLTNSLNVIKINDIIVTIGVFPLVLGEELGLVINLITLFIKLDLLV
jgi:hypothetical protein